jgi:hypothetical protein
MQRTASQPSDLPSSCLPFNLWLRGRCAGLAVADLVLVRRCSHLVRTKHYVHPAYRIAAALMAVASACALIANFRPQFRIAQAIIMICAGFITPFLIIYSAVKSRPSTIALLLAGEWRARMSIGAALRRGAVLAVEEGSKSMLALLSTVDARPPPVRTGCTGRSPIEECADQGLTPTAVIDEPTLDSLGMG